MNIKITEPGADFFGEVQARVIERCHGLPQDEAQTSAAVAVVLAQMVQEKQLNYVKTGLARDAALMKEVIAETKPAETPKKGFRLLYKMTSAQDQALRDMRFDGREDWQTNPDVLKFLPQTEDFAFLREFPLASVDPREFGLRKSEK